MSYVGPMVKTPVQILTLAGCLTIATSTPVFAYLDGGTVTMITQIIVGSIAGISAYVGLRFYSVRAYFRRLFGREEPGPEAGKSQDAPKE